MKKIVITGGHHSSAIPVIHELLKRNSNIKISWFGHKYSLGGDRHTSLEYREITGMNIPFYDLKAGKFYNNFNIIKLLRIPFSFFQALYLLLKTKPDVILSFGGYLAVPVVIVGRFLGIPSITHEQTVTVGYANKLISYFVNKIMISWPQSAEYLPKNKIIYSGLPLRPEIYNTNSNYYKFKNNMPVIYITAGKSGSHKINNAIYKSLENLLDKANIIHQCGDYSRYNDYENLSQKYIKIKAKHRGSYFLEKFIYSDHIGEVFHKSDLVISRSGAHICFELIKLNKPCLLIPIPWVSHNEQYLNAKQVVELGLGEIIDEENINTDLFLQFINKMLDNLQNYQIRKDFSFIDNSAEIIVNEINKLA